VDRSLATLARVAGAWTVRAFRRCPAHLVRCAKDLGCIHGPARQEVVRSWLRHALLTLDAEGMPADQLVRTIERHRPADVHNPVPRKLHRAIMEVWSLRPAQLQRALDKVRADLVVTRVDLLRRLALDHLTRAVGPVPDTAEARHALCLQGLICDNRRALRRLLRAYFDGHHSYRTEHPANRNWWTKHSHLGEAWLHGLPWSVTVPDGRYVGLAIESDPLEILRLGTYVGTCLGIGGIMADSAAAVALDINKQVLYARDASGRILARQLLALSEDERLVCFHVYPLEVEAAIRQAFWEYDKALAKALRVELYEPKPNPAGYEIQNLVSSYWWDDGPWDGSTDSVP
jgi:hypothetical protein